MPPGTTPLPVKPETLRQVLDGDRTRAALAALVVFHALTSGQLRTLKTTDVRDGRLFLGDRRILLAPEVRSRLNAYLRYRTHRWPRTANEHLFISLTTACGTAPVSGVWINELLGIPASRLHFDRILDEAQATGGDIRRVCDLFGLTVGAALRYTSTVEQEGVVEYALRKSTPDGRGSAASSQ
ncbi:hypothetical protein [Kitasatospora sp. NPDC058046]|uniref:hypothetical protein n=1 Tax=Kitasatospora sp. NPDC058046 TaxID=3346312 RepID=UPI0036D788F0